MSSPVMRRVRGEQTPTSSPVLSRPLTDEDMTPDILAERIHDPRQTMSQQPFATSPQVSTPGSTHSVPAFLDSSITKKMVFEDKLCDGPYCVPCRRRKRYGLTDADIDVGPDDPHFDVEFEGIELVNKNYSLIHMNMLFMILFSPAPTPIVPEILGWLLQSG